MKASMISVGNKLQCCSLLPTFIMKGKANFQIEVCRNEDVHFPHPSSWTLVLT